MDIFSNEIGVSLESIDTINIQPKKTILGAKIKATLDGSIAPILTLDTKKLIDKSDLTPPEDLVDEALKNFWENEEE